MLLSWNNNSGFDVHRKDRIDGSYRETIERVARYMCRAALFVGRMEQNFEDGSFYSHKFLFRVSFYTFAVILLIRQWNTRSLNPRLFQIFILTGHRFNYRGGKYSKISQKKQRPTMSQNYKTFNKKILNYTVFGSHTLALKGEAFPQVLHMYLIFDIIGTHRCLEFTPDLPHVSQV